MEGAANDWLNLSMVDGYDYSTAAASAAFAFFLLMMTPARVSVLSTVNYGAALIGPPLLGPPLLGLVADHIGYHRALAFVALPILLAIVLAGQVPDRRGTRRTDLVFGD